MGMKSEMTSLNVIGISLEENYYNNYKISL